MHDPFGRVESIPFASRLVLVRNHREIMVRNETARLIWEAVADGASIAQIADAIRLRVGLASQRARADVERCLADWRGRGLLTRSVAARSCEPLRTSGAKAPPRDFDATQLYALSGRPIRFRFRDPGLERLIRPLLAPLQHPDKAAETIDLYQEGTDHVVAANSVEVGRSPVLEEGLGLALGRLVELSYPHARWLAAFHAGAVADQHRAIVMPAQSGSGKSTLTAGLVSAGLRYLSDDVVPFDGWSGQNLAGAARAVAQAGELVPARAILPRTRSIAGASRWRMVPTLSFPGTT